MIKLLLLTLITGCCTLPATKRYSTNKNFINKTFLEFKRDFNVDRNGYRVVIVPPNALSTVTGDKYRPNRKADAECNPITEIIAINSKFWPTINKWQRKELLYHEYGHCILGMSHTKKRNRIMNSFAPNKFWVKEDGSNWNYLVNKMKQRGRR